MRKRIAELVLSLKESLTKLTSPMIQRENLKVQILLFAAKTMIPAKNGSELLRRKF